MLAMGKGYHRSYDQSLRILEYVSACLLSTLRYSRDSSPSNVSSAKTFWPVNGVNSLQKQPIQLYMLGHTTSSTQQAGALKHSWETTL
jgi:hypothetical protein